MNTIPPEQESPKPDHQNEFSVWPPRGIPPYWPFPGPYWPPMFRAGVSAGDMHGKLCREMIRYRAAAGGDPVRLMHDLLGRMDAKGLIRHGEVEQLSRIVKVASSKAAPAEMLKPVRAVQTALIDDESSSPAALAIASIALDSILTAIETGNESWVGADVGGACGGLIFGGLVGAVVCGAMASVTASNF